MGCLEIVAASVGGGEKTKEMIWRQLIVWRGGDDDDDDDEEEDDDDEGVVRSLRR